MVLQDDSFRVNSPTTIRTRNSAEKFLAWCGENKMLSTNFSEKLKDMLQKVIVLGVTKSFNYNREKLWKQFYLLRTSEVFLKLWNNFLPPLQPSVEPVLYQHLIDKIFEILVQEYCQQEHLDPEVTPMQQNKCSALRYIAGYTCRHLHKKIEKENDETKGRDGFMLDDTD